MNSPLRFLVRSNVIPLVSNQLNSENQDSKLWIKVILKLKIQNQITKYESTVTKSRHASWGRRTAADPSRAEGYS